jgi:pimeloyl-[acyl-carrier protein] synthase
MVSVGRVERVGRKVTGIEAQDSCTERLGYTDRRKVIPQTANGKEVLLMAAPLEATSSTLPGKAPLDLFAPLRSAGSLENPYPVYALLRSIRPVLPVPLPDFDGPGVCLLTRYEDVNSVLRDARFSADRLAAPVVRDNLDRLPPFIRQSADGLRTMLVMDAPDHTRVRKLVNKAFTPKRIAMLRGHIQAIVDGCVERVASAGRCDLIHDLAEPVPAVVIAELLGVAPEDHRQFREWSSSLIAGLAALNDDRAQAAARSASEKIFAYLQQTIAARRSEPRDDLISAMIQAQEERDALTDLELLATSNLLLLAGHETTTNLIGNGMLALLREPEQLDRLRRDESLWPCAIEELLRYDGPVQATLRVATEDVEIGTRLLPAGTMVIVSIGAANHDPEVFDEPDCLDIARNPNPHLAFGFGAHFCMGANLARLEAEVALRTMCARFDTITLEDDAPQYRPNPILRGISRLDLTVA